MCIPKYKTFCSKIFGNAGNWESDIFGRTLAERGQTVNRRRAARSDGTQAELKDSFDVLVDDPFPRPFYPQHAAISGSTNLANADRHNLQYLPAIDIKEGDYITFSVDTDYEWVVDKLSPPYAPGNKLILRQCEIRRNRKNETRNSSQ